MALLATLALGCSGEARVTGKVTLGEQALTQAQVIFVGTQENEAPVVAFTDERGEYRLIGHKGRGIRPGKYKVTVSKETLKDGTLPQGERLNQARTAGLLREVVPPEYTDAAKTPLLFDVGSGDNTLDIPLKKR